MPSGMPPSESRPRPAPTIWWAIPRTPERASDRRRSHSPRTLRSPPIQRWRAWSRCRRRTTRRPGGPWRRPDSSFGKSAIWTPTTRPTPDQAPSTSRADRFSRDRDAPLARLARSRRLRWENLTVAAERGAIRSFDPVRLGLYEADAWVAYYRRRWPAFLIAAIGMVRIGSGLGWTTSAVAAWHVLRANQFWASFPDN